MKTCWIFENKFVCWLKLCGLRLGAWSLHGRLKSQVSHVFLKTDLYAEIQNWIYSIHWRYIKVFKPSNELIFKLICSKMFCMKITRRCLTTMALQDLPAPFDQLFVLIFLLVCDNLKSDLNFMFLPFLLKKNIFNKISFKSLGDLWGISGTDLLFHDWFHII